MSVAREASQPAAEVSVPPSDSISEAICGAAFLDGEQWGDWNGNLLVTVDSGANQDTVAEFNAAGQKLNNYDKAGRLFEEIDALLARGELGHGAEQAAGPDAIKRRNDTMQAFAALPRARDWTRSLYERGAQ